MDAYIVCGGPSLAGFDFNKLKGKDVIAVNKSMFFVPWAKYFVTIDYSFMLKIKNDLHKFKAHKAKKYFIANMANASLECINGKYTDVKNRLEYDLRLFDEVIESHSISGLGTTFKDFKSGDNSGFCAMQLALLLGYDRVYMLGLDLTVSRSRTHFHDGYNVPFEKTNRFIERFRPIFMKALSQTDKVYSCTPNSPINEIIPYVEFESTL